MKNKNNFDHEIKGLAFNFIFIIIVSLVVLNFYQNIILTTMLLFAITLVALFKWKSYQTLIVFAAGGLIITIFEIMSVKQGILLYSPANIFNIPSWLFFFWGNLSIFFYRLYIEIKKIKMKL